jgi:hypothetical protein
VRVDSGAKNEAGWTAQASEVMRRIRTEWGSGDCLDLRVRPDTSGAWLEFRGHGGIARRHLAAAKELVPAVRALLVRVDTDYFATAPSVEAPDSGPQNKTTETSAMPKVHFGTTLGVRLGIGNGNLIESPALGGFAAMQADGWELGVTGQWEFGYHEAVIDQEPDWSASALTMGVMAGRRVPVGKWDLAAGVQLAGSFVQGQTDDEDPHRNAERTDARIGGYFAIIGPRDSHVRLRANAGIDVVPARIATPASVGIRPADLPGWMGTFSLGVEGP